MCLGFLWRETGSERRGRHGLNWMGPPKLHHPAPALLPECQAPHLSAMPYPPTQQLTAACHMTLRPRWNVEHFRTEHLDWKLVLGLRALVCRGQSEIVTSGALRLLRAWNIRLGCSKGEGDGGIKRTQDHNRRHTYPASSGQCQRTVTIFLNVTVA